MKKLMLLIALTSTIFGCNEYSDSNKIKDNCKDFLFKNINDPSTYESVEWGKIDTISKGNPYYTETYLNYNKLKSEAYNARIADSITLAILDLPRYRKEEIAESIKYWRNVEKGYSDSLTMYLSDYVNNKLGYKISHRFRTKNENNALVLKEVVFLFDSTNKVTGMSFVPINNQ